MSAPVLYAAAAPVLLEAGWPSPLPLPVAKKFPPPEGYTGDAGAMPTEAEITKWVRTKAGGNVALRLPDGVIGVDVDHYGAKAGGDSLAELEARWGPLPATWISSARPLPSGVRLFRVPTGTKVNDKPAAYIEILQRHHRYAVVAPSNHPDAGAAYRWLEPSGAVSDRPPRPEELAELPPAWLEGLSESKAAGARTPAGPDCTRVQSAGYRSPAVERALRIALLDLPGGRHDAALVGVQALVRLEEREHPGAADAIVDLRGSFLSAVTGDGSRTQDLALHEWDQMLAGAKAKVSATSATTPKWEEANGKAAESVRTEGGRPAPAADDAAGEEERPAFFTDQGRLIVERLASTIRDEGNLLLGHDGRLYRYDGGVYRGDGDTFARVRVRERLGWMAKRSHYDEVMTWLRASFVGIDPDPRTDVFNVANGLLEWRKGTLRPHTAEEPSTIQLPVAWNPEAACPGIDRFLGEVLPVDALEFIFEVIGYAMYPANPLRQAVLLLGPGRNGKSVLLALVRRLLGDANVCAVPLQMLAENRFAAAELFGKLANISGDLDARAIQRTDLFKMATGGDPIPAEHKYGQPFFFVPFALQMFSANEAPISSDQSRAWFDRWLVVPLDRRIAEDKVDPHLLARLSTPAELEGLAVKAVEGLRRLMARGRFDQPASVQEAGARYRDRLDTARAFVAEECVLHADAWVPRSALYQHYRTWARDGGRLPVSAVNFNDHIRANYGDVVVEAGRQGVRGWSGLGLAAAGGTT